MKILKNTFSAAVTGRPRMELLGKLQIPVSEQIILLPFTAGHAPLHVNLLPMLPMYRSTEPQPGRQHTRPPHSAAASLSTRQANRELELGET